MDYAPGYSAARAASQALLRAGIRGIKYLDATSRGKGEGSFNYVVFDPRDITIQERFAVATPQGKSFSEPDHTLIQRGKVALVDEFIRLFNLEQAADIDPENSAYRILRLLSKRIAGQLVKFRNDYNKGIIQPLRKAGAKLADFDRYRYARHAPDRNKAIMRKYPERKTGEEFNPGSGMRTSTANRIRQEYESGEHGDLFARMADAMDEMHSESLDRQVELGLRSQEEADALRDLFGPHYVPLATVGEPELDPFAAGGSMQVRGAESKKAKGRRTLAKHLTAQSFAQMEEVFFRGERTRFGQQLFKIALENENPDVWEPYEDYKAIPDEDKKANRVWTFKDGGVEKYVVLRDEALNTALRRMDVKIGDAIRYIGGAANFFKRLHTSWNLAFMLPNTVRDAGMAGITLASEESVGFALDVLNPKRMAVNAYALFKVARDFDAMGKGTKSAREFITDGGQTNWVPRLPMAARIKEIENAVEGGQVKSGLRGLVTLLEDLSGALENATRLSTYQVYRERGASRDKAGFGAGNVTVDFFRKGTWSQGLGALYLFFNPGVQGTARIASIYANPKSRPKAAALSASITALAFGIAALNRHLGGEDDDGFNYWDTVAPWQLERQMVLILPGTKGKQFRMPLPWGFNVFFYLGSLMERVAFGTEEPERAAARLASASLEAFVPIGGEANLSQNISPWFMDPFVQQGQNQTWYGAPIMPEGSPYDAAPPPDSQRYWPTVNPAAREVTAWLNSITGGSEVTPGLIDVSPESIEHWGQFMFGGAGRTMGRTATSVQKALEGEDVSMNQLPILNRFVGQPDERFLVMDMREAESAIAYEKKKKAQGLRFDARLLRLERRLKAAKAAVKRARQRDDKDGENAARRAFVKAWRSMKS